MTTHVHSGHKSIPPTHLGVARSGDAYSYVQGTTDPLILGQYRILECLGSGGMGKVFRAEHQLMGRQVAIKVMAPALLSDTESCERFRQEVRLVAQLSHPHIVMAHDANEEQGVHFFVMEYVSGADLGQIVSSYGPLPIPFACECIRQTALGLQHAHEHGLVHCDIKPSNLLLRDGMTSVYSFLARATGESGSDRPLIKILDFGLARLAGKASDADSRRGSPESCFCGTPDFMAPELGRDSTTVDIRCDLYSLGCTFSFLLTGQVPYPGGSWSEKLIRHHYDPAVPVCQMRPDVPPEVVEIVGRLMAKDPVDRFSTPGEVAAAIQAWQEAETSSTSSVLLPASERPAQKPARQLTSDTILLLDNNAASQAEAAARCSTETRAGPRRRLPFGWPLAVSVAIAIGLGSAWIVCTPLLSQSVKSFDRWSRATRGEAHFHVGGHDEAFVRLEQAVNAARDGDTIFVRGDGPFVFHGLSLRGKSLTIKADADSHPRFDLIPAQKESAWEPLLVANRPLTLQGLHLNYGGEKFTAASPAVAHLVYAEGSELKLVDCTLTGTNAQALVVCRQSPRVELEGCTVSANASALCIETCERGSTKINLRRNQFEARDPGAAALVCWANSPVREGCLFELEENEFDGSRLLALNNLDGPVSVRADKNTFRFQQSLLSVLSRSSSKLTNLVTWQGTANRFAAGSRWITWNSEALPVNNLATWRECLRSSETGSLESKVAAAPAVSVGSN